MKLRRRIIRHHLVLILGLVAAAFCFLLAWPEPFWLRMIAVSLGAFYAVWGMYSHMRMDTLTRTVVAEYCSIGIFGTVLLWLITL